MYNGLHEQLESAWESGKAAYNYSRFLLLCETLINDGTPSGFKPVVESRFSPERGPIDLEIPLIEVAEELVTRVGLLPPWIPQSEGKAWLPIHPRLASELDGDHIAASIRAVPTASIRTVAVISEDSVIAGFVKLHYPDVLGRFARDLYHFKWYASLEADAAFAEAQERDPSLQRLPESFGWYYEPPAVTRGWGVLGRTISSSLLARPLVPAFSVLARKGDYWFLRKMQSIHQWAFDDAAELIGVRLIHAYIKLVLQWGLLPECNAQNVLFSVTESGAVEPVFRDMGDIFKDIPIRKANGLSTRFGSYKTIDEGMHDLFKRRSFSYDFKLGEYILKPLANAISKVWDVESGRVTEFLRSKAVASWPASCGEYFEDTNVWYSYPPRDDVSRNSYVPNLSPAFR